MSAEDDAKKRFDQTGAQVKVTFVPQCNTCVKNIGIEDCTEFHPKPLEYRRNEKECPKKIKNN